MTIGRIIDISSNNHPGDAPIDRVEIVSGVLPTGLVMDDDGADIEEALTFYWLRAEIVELHTGFSVTGFLSTLGETARSQMASETIPTSPEPSEA